MLLQSVFGQIYVFSRGTIHLVNRQQYGSQLVRTMVLILDGNVGTVCPGSSDPPQKMFNIFASEIEVYTIFNYIRYFWVNIVRLQSKIILGHMNSIG